MIHGLVLMRAKRWPVAPWISSGRLRKAAPENSCNMPLAWTRAAAKCPSISEYSHKVNVTKVKWPCICSCRVTQGVFDKCMKDNLDMDRPHYGYFTRAKVFASNMDSFRLDAFYVNCFCSPSWIQLSRSMTLNAQHQRKKRKLFIRMQRPACPRITPLLPLNMAPGFIGWNKDRERPRTAIFY